MDTLRTTIRLEAGLLRNAKRLAVETGRTLTAVISDALRETLARRTPSKRPPAFKLPTFRGTGPRPGVDLDRTSELLDLPDEDGNRR